MAEIIISNKMSTTFNLEAVGENLVDFEITVGNYVDSTVDFEVQARASTSNEKHFEVKVVYDGISDVWFEVQPTIISSVDFEVMVNPHNKMSVIYELVPPPTIEVEIASIKDTFISSNSPYNVINYGLNNSMRVGNDNYGNSTSFIEFDLSSIPNDVTIKSAELQVNYNYYDNQKIDIARVIGDWSEDTFTYNNNTTQLNKLAVNSRIDTTALNMYFDLTSLVRDWHRGLTNNGVALTSEDNVILFKTRESGTPPKLIVTYYSSLPYSTKSSNTPFEVTAVQSDNRSVDFEVNVISYLQHSDKLFEVHAINRNNMAESYLSSDFEVEVKEYTNESNVDFEVKVVNSDQSLILFEVTVNEYLGEGNVDFEVSVPDYGNASVDFEVSVIAKDYYSDVSFEVTATKQYIEEVTEVEFSVEVREYVAWLDVPFEVTVLNERKGTSDVSFEVTVSKFESDSSVDFEIVVPVRNVHEDTWFEIGVYGYSDSKVDFEVYPRIPYIDEVQFEVTVGFEIKKNIYVYML